MNARIRVRTQVPGLHHWPDAPERRFYLRAVHRHMFHVSVMVEVGHDDRAVEFHDLDSAVRAAVRDLGRTRADGLSDFGAMSCESLARALWGQLADDFSVVEVTWGEDGEFDAVLSRGD